MILLLVFPLPWPLLQLFQITEIVITQAHDFAVCYEVGAKLRVVVQLQHHQHADNLSCDEGVIKALFGHRLQRETAVHLHCSLRVRRLQQLHKLDICIMDLDSEFIHQPQREELTLDTHQMPVISLKNISICDMQVIVNFFFFSCNTQDFLCINQFVQTVNQIQTNNYLLEISFLCNSTSSSVCQVKGALWSFLVSSHFLIQSFSQKLICDL